MTAQSARRALSEEKKRDTDLQNQNDDAGTGPNESGLVKHHERTKKTAEMQTYLPYMPMRDA